MAELFDQAHDWFHPDYPFQDPRYAAGSRVQAIDFTQAVAAWLASGEVEAIGELWQCASIRPDCPSCFAQRDLRSRPVRFGTHAETVRLRLGYLWKEPKARLAQRVYSKSWLPLAGKSCHGTNPKKNSGTSAPRISSNPFAPRTPLPKRRR